MNISYNWLKDYVQTNLSPQELSDALTSIGLETGSVEKVETIKGGLEGLFIGLIMTCEAHPNSDHLHITSVDIGQQSPLQIVCGAGNVAKDQKVIVAINGTKLYSGDESFTIKKSKIRGVESNGMICAEDEIGVGKSHEGIIVLPQEALVGMPAKEYYKIEADYILEVDITPNRVDAASHYGVARDLAAYLSQQGEKSMLSKPNIDKFKIDDQETKLDIIVENTEACARYTGICLKNIEVKESPKWLLNRLQAIGIRSINNVVDASNYVLHELGQPLHTFDLRAITSNTIRIKTLAQDSLFTTLDGVERKLNAQDLMICNDNEAMCMAGIFGGLQSGVSLSTTDIFIESAYFNPTSVRKTARRHGLNTDSSFRFERGADPNICVYALKRAALLIQELAGGSISGPLHDIYPIEIKPKLVDLAISKINQVIGKVLPIDTITSILQQLEIEILSQDDQNLQLAIPTYRVDVLRDVDVIEDILRIYGYNNIEIGDRLQANLSSRTATDKSYQIQKTISEQLAGAGFNEILNNSLSSSAYYQELTDMGTHKSVKIRNPLSASLDVMRQSLLFGGLETISYNINRKNTDLKIYEFGNVYSYNQDKLKDDKALTAIRENFNLALFVTGNKIQNNWAHANEKASVFELKAHVENILCRLGIGNKKIKYSTYTNEIFSSALLIQTMAGRKLGVFGLVGKPNLKKFDIDVEVYFAELDWNALMKENESQKVAYSEISKYPAVKRDFALLVDISLSFGEIEKVAYEADRKILKELILFDVYEGENLPAGKKSYAISFVLKDESKTLNDKQIDAIMTKIKTNLEQKLGATLR
ncbi:phenylalanine tRNA synthetase beta subunit [Bacteroidales bacterium]|nr:phenylalanine tRNA synthetase beta subunit [Bacteroidales bacterium]